MIHPLGARTGYGAETVKKLARSLALCVLTTCSVTGLAAETQQMTIPYDLERDAQVSVLITDEGGSVVRELLHAAPRNKGENAETWDGLDEQGKPAPAGTYTWKLLATQGLNAEYVMTIGTNPDPRWAAWPGNHGGVYGIAADASGMYLATGCGEATPLCIKQDYEGKRIWTIPHWFQAWSGPCSIGIDAGRLYTLEINQKVYVVDADTGKRLTDGWDVSFESDRKKAVFNMPHDVTDLDAGHGQVIVSYALQNLVRWLDPQTGKVIDEAAVDEPYGVAAMADGALLAISKDSVVRLSRADKRPKTVIAKDKLSGAYRLAIHQASGDILVAENLSKRMYIDYHYFDRGPRRPESAMTTYYTGAVPENYKFASGRQVKRFSKDGRPIAAYGRPGGWIEGPYDPTVFCGIGDIAAAPDGGFIVSDADPIRRTALFDRSGKWLHDWYGGWNYALYAIVDPDDITSVWFVARGAFVQTKVDYQRKTFRIIAAYTIPSLFGQQGGNWAIRRHDGQMYFCRTGGQHKGPAIFRLDQKNNRMVLTTVGNSVTSHDKENELNGQPLLRQLYETREGERWMWTDFNGDGTPQPDEFKFSPTYTRGQGWFIDNDFTYYYHHQTDKLDLVCMYKLPVREWTKAGVPAYDWADATLFAEDKGCACDVWRDDDGNVYKAYNSDGVFNKSFGVGWWSPRCGMNRVAKWNKAGKPQWTVGRHAPGSKALPGEMKYIWAIVGSVNGSIAVMDAEDSMTHVWDQDGLFVGRLLERPVISPESPREAYELCYENFAGALRKDAKTGDVYYFGGGNNNINVFRITGWDGWTRQHGTVQLPAAIAATLKARADAEAARTDVARIPFLDVNRIKLDGKLDEWIQCKITPFEIKDGEQVLAKAYLAYYAEGIFAAFDVNTNTPWKSAATPQLAFQGGAAVDLSFGPFEPNRKAAGIGDLRVVAAPVGNDGLALPVEFVPVVTDDERKNRLSPATYETGNGKITFENVVPLPKDWAAAEAKPDGSGYVVEFRTRRTTAMEWKPGMRFRLDASVILANPEGTRSAMRLPWHSRDPGDMAVQDTYFESLLRPANWAEAVLE